MSFSFNGFGTKDEVIAQVTAADVDGNEIGDAAKKLVVEALEADETTNGPGWEYRYVVQAHGHSGGGSPLQLTMSIATHNVRSVSGDAAPEPAGTGG